MLLAAHPEPDWQIVEDREVTIVYSYSHKGTGKGFGWNIGAG